MHALTHRRETRLARLRALPAHRLGPADADELERLEEAHALFLRRLPGQLARARRRVADLEALARRVGLRNL